jgi:hypothetical protein
MFVYCLEVLHLSEPETNLRIVVARAARRHTALLEMLRDGRLHLSGIALLATCQRAFGSCPTRGRVLSSSGKTTPSSGRTLPRRGRILSSRDRSLRRPRASPSSPSSYLVRTR